MRAGRRDEISAPNAGLRPPESRTRNRPSPGPETQRFAPGGGDEISAAEVRENRPERRPEPGLLAPSPAPRPEGEAQVALVPRRNGSARRRPRVSATRSRERRLPSRGVRGRSEWRRVRGSPARVVSSGGARARALTGAAPDSSAPRDAPPSGRDDDLPLPLPAPPIPFAPQTPAPRLPPSLKTTPPSTPTEHTFRLTAPVCLVCHPRNRTGKPLRNRAKPPSGGGGERCRKIPVRTWPECGFSL